MVRIRQNRSKTKIQLTEREGDDSDLEGLANSSYITMDQYTNQIREDNVPKLVWPAILPATKFEWKGQFLNLLK